MCFLHPFGLIVVKISVTFLRDAIHVTPTRGGGGGGYLTHFLLGMCGWHLRTSTP